MKPIPLNLAQEQFIHNYLTEPGRNATTAYMLAYPNCKSTTAAVQASRLLDDPRVSTRVAAFEAALLKRTHLTADQILQQLGMLATADPRDLIDYRRGACRYCHGIGFRYFYRPQEYRDAMALHQKETRGADPMGLSFDYKGGVGFSQAADPHPDCPECDGRGVGYTYARDLRTVSPTAARLFAGIKETKDGFEIKTRSQDKAVELIAKHLGLLKDTGVDGEASVPPAGTVTYEVEDGRRAPDAEA